MTTTDEDKAQRSQLLGVQYLSPYHQNSMGVGTARYHRNHSISRSAIVRNVVSLRKQCERNIDGPKLATYNPRCAAQSCLLGLSVQNMSSKSVRNFLELSHAEADTQMDI